jgi:hypothetical protein
MRLARIRRDDRSETTHRGDRQTAMSQHKFPVLD